jgi:hypothetical protein
MKFRNGAFTRDSIALSLFGGMPHVRARFAYLSPSERRQTNAGDTHGWRDALLHWLIEGLRYAAQATAMREGHPWDIKLRVALGTQDKCHGVIPLETATSKNFECRLSGEQNETASARSWPGVADGGLISGIGPVSASDERLLCGIGKCCRMIEYHDM